MRGLPDDGQIEDLRSHEETCEGRLSVGSGLQAGSSGGGWICVSSKAQPLFKDSLLS